MNREFKRTGRRPFAVGRLAGAAHLRWWLAAALTATMAGSLISAPALAEPTPPSSHLTPQAEKLDDDGGEVAGLGWPTNPGKQIDLPAPVWPAAGSPLQVRSKPAADRKAASASAAEAAPAFAATVVDPAAVPAPWKAGVVAKVAGTTSGTASVAIDYAKFRHAYGGDWASRLRWWRLPDCALTTPEKTGCTATPLPSANDTATTTVTAEVPVTAPKTSTATARTAAAATTMVALAAAPSGPSGDFGATSLSASSTWSVGGSTGDFAWSYPMRAPNGINGPQPGLSLAYSSSSVDGRSSASNNQPSWIGEGFEFGAGGVERRYVPCDDDKSGTPNNPAQTGDLCWRSNNAVLSLGGSTTELVYEDGKGWHGRSENASKIELLPGADNGDDDGEHWKVTTNDGTQYFFGLNKLPGQSKETNSTFTVPVYGNHDKEPCHATKFADSDCTQAWRWSLDYAVDTHGNTISYWYTKETNRYAAEGTATKLVPYVRAGYLNRIDYGTWDRGTADRSVTPLAQVNFTTNDRCLSDCATHDGPHWPDTPWDQECKTTATTCEDFSPTFWTTQRLTNIKTRVWDTTKTTPGWQDVDSWTLDHSFPSPGDGENGGLWLKSIQHTGLVGGETKMPPVTFDPTSKPNRVLTKTNTTNNWHRIAAIHTETGAMVKVTYSQPECTRTNLPAEAHNNTKRCYPVIGPDPNSTSGADITEWWHKYVVEQVTETDVQLADGHQAPPKNTFYTYEGAPFWHYADDDGLGKPKYKTWDQFRGYKTVTTRVGDTNPTLTKTTYLRGMHGDKLAPTGGPRTEILSASMGTETVYDEDQFAGIVREQVVYNGTDDKPVSKTVNVPWRSPATASRTINKDTVSAHFVNIATVYAGTALGVNGSRGWRVTSSTTKFDDDYGLPVSVQDNGDDATTGDEKCTTTTYNRNITKNLIALPSRVTTTALPCGVAPTRPEQMVDDAVTFYDGAANASTPPSKGNLTRTDLMKDWTAAGGTVWLISGRSTFDAFGRQETATDVRGNVEKTAYSPANGLVTQTKKTIKTDWNTTTTFNPAWSAPMQTTDPNGRVTNVIYDPLGRVWKTWNAGWKYSNHQTQPSATYTYVFDQSRKNYPYIKSETLNTGGAVDVSYVIFDGFLRSRQTQRAAIGEGRVVADTLYDQYGNASMSYAAHAEKGTASGTLWWEPDWSVPAQTVTAFDRAGRPTDQIFQSGDGVTNVVEKWRVTTGYEGDRTTVVPPQGGTATTTLTDVLGRTKELRQYTTAAGISGPYDATEYHYDAKNRMTSAEDSADNRWTYTYDLLGRLVATNDPDKGETRSEYNDFGDLTLTEDARDQILAYTYDDLGRKTGLYSGSVAEANKRAEWKYDKLFTARLVRGHLTEKIRYETAANGTRQPYTWQAVGYNDRYQLVGEQWIIPAAETGLGNTYSFDYTYVETTGAPAQTTYPAAGGLAKEAVTTSYNPVTGLPNALTSLWSTVGTYVAGQTYTAYGETSTTTVKTGVSTSVEQAYDYERDTRRLHRTTVHPKSLTGTVLDRTYHYDVAGNIDHITDAPNIGQGEKQCFTHDALRRLTSAWTPKPEIECSTAPTAANLVGPAPYWTDWTLDPQGNRTKQVSHSTTGDTVYDYTVPAGGPNVVRPHAVTTLKKTTPDQSSTTVGYTYDKAGNMTSRPGTTATQQLTWDAEGRATKIVEGAVESTNLYEADGSRLIRRDSTGATLYLPGMEIRRITSGNTNISDATRYYNFAGNTVASRTPASDGLTWLFDDHQGTQQVAVNANSQQVNIRRQSPYGETRGISPTWPNGKGFVGGDIDSTGLIHVGVREYDPTLGRFISVDPVQDLLDPQQWNAYAYANNSPINNSDPSGAHYNNDIGDSSRAATPKEIEDANKATSGQTSTPRQHSTGYVQPAPKPAKKKSWYSPVTDRLEQAADFVNEHKNTIIGVGVGIITYAGCTSATVGGGVIACMGVAGAASSMTTTWLDGGDAIDVAVAGVEGAILGVLAVPVAVADLAQRADATVNALADGDYSEAVKQGALGALDVAVVAGVRGGCKHSFTADTEVQLADGSTKPISDIEVGEKVLATDPETGATSAEKVEVLHDNLDRDFVDVTVKLPNGTTSVINTTAEHPFWDETDRKWTDAADLKAGHQLRDQNGRPSVTIVHVDAFKGEHHMHNLTVANLHTYYVLAGKTPVLVHNDDPNWFPNRELPRTPGGHPMPDPDAAGYEHTQLGTKSGRRGSYPQAREFDAQGRPVRDIDFTDHGRPANHTNPHEHPYLENSTGGTPQRGPAQPMRGC